jgi:hypothetical protein
MKNDKFHYALRAVFDWPKSGLAFQPLAQNMEAISPLPGTVASVAILVSSGTGKWGDGSERKPASRGTQFGAVGRRRLTEVGAPWWRSKGGGHTGATPDERCVPPVVRLDSTRKER